MVHTEKHRHAAGEAMMRMPVADHACVVAGDGYSLGAVRPLRRWAALPQLTFPGMLSVCTP